MKLMKGFRLASWSALVAAVLCLPLVSGSSPRAQVLPLLSAPIANPPGKTFSSLATGITVTLTAASPDAYILYTTDGTEPDSQVGARTRLYAGPIVVNTTTLLKALAKKNGYAVSPTMTEIYVAIAPPKVAKPVASPLSGAYYDTLLVALTCATPGAAIYYTLNGSMPNVLESSMKYTKPILLQTTVTLKAIALVEGSLPSDVLTVVYVFAPTSVHSPGKTTSLGRRAGEMLRTWSGRRLDGAKL